MTNHYLLGLQSRRVSPPVSDHDWNDLERGAMLRGRCLGKGDDNPAPSGGQTATPSATTINQTSLPDWAKPYMTQVLAQGQALSQNDYTTYPGQQLAPFSDQQIQSFNLAGQLGQATQPVWNQAQGFMGQAGQAGANAGNYSPGNISANYDATTGSWLDPDVSSSFMNPYQRQVTNQAIMDIRDQGDLQAAQIRSNAARAGAFGGDRETVAQGLNNYNTQRNVGNAAAQGANAAYMSGQGQFNAEGQQDLQSRQYGAGLGMEAQKAYEQSRQFGGNLGLQGGQLQNTSGQNLSYLGTAMQNANLQDVNALQTAGGLQQAQLQSSRNIGYQNFLNELNHPYQQLGFQAGLINGLPLGTIGQTSNYQNPNQVSQLLGLGIGGLGLSQALRGT